MPRPLAILYWASLTLLILLLLTWARSTLTNQLHIYFLNGKLTLFNIEASDQEYEGDIIDHGPQQAIDYLTNYAATHNAAIGFAYTTGDYHIRLNNSAHITHYRILQIPLWSLVLVSAATFTYAATKRRQLNQRASSNQCKTCGYDLRATPKQNGPLLEKCPECGAATTPQP